MIGRGCETSWSGQPLTSMYSRRQARKTVLKLPEPKWKPKGLMDEVEIVSLFK